MNGYVPKVGERFIANPGIIKPKEEVVSHYLVFDRLCDSGLRRTKDRNEAQPGKLAGIVTESDACYSPSECKKITTIKS